MDTSTLVWLGIAGILFIVVYLKAPESAGKGLRAGVGLFVEILPRMISAFIIAGFIQAIVPQEIIARWMGREAGMRGIFVGMGLGTVTPGGPMMQFPIIASLYASGVSIGPLVSYLTAWSLLGFHRAIVWEIPFLGLKVVLIRLLVSLLFPLIAGWLSEYLWEKINIS